MLKRILLSSLLIVTLSDAEDSFSSERFIGIEVGYSSADTTSAIDKKSISKDIEYGFHIGAQNKEWRTTVSLSLYGDKKKEYKRTMLEFDRFVWASLYKKDHIVFKPYLGGHIGYLNYTDEGGIDESGLLYGAQAGLAWNVLDEVDFDVSYRYSISDLSYVDDIGSFVFGANYIY
jgi:opacity protein-like surface antigen